MRLKWLWTGLAVMALSLPAGAQEVVGSSIVGGRPVQLMSNFTWKYNSPTPSSCQAVKDTISFCGQNGGWTQVSNGDKDIAAQFRLNDRTYGMFVVEELGSDDGMNEDFMLDIVVKHAADVAGVQKKDIVTIGPDATMVDGRPGKSITYFAKMQGLPLVFTNTVVVDKHRTVQVATYSVGGTLTDEMKLNHKNFLAATRLK